MPPDCSGPHWAGCDRHACEAGAGCIGRDLACSTLAKVAELGQRAGVTFCLENLNTEVDHPGVPFARAADTLALVEAVSSPHLRLNLDLYHAQVGEGNRINATTWHNTDLFQDGYAAQLASFMDAVRARFLAPYGIVQLLAPYNQKVIVKS
ncbi:TIM barrel protein [Caballeronia sp.]|uniref:TIM barrel protein n=1 Tax=Caballeronia sp. TaxID=1931223 RepID=UPI003C6FE044